MLCHVSKPHKTSVVCGQPDLSALFDVINLTAYTGLILQALVLPHLGRVLKMLSLALAPSDALESEPWQGCAGVTVPVCSQITEFLAAGCPLKPEKAEGRVDGWRLCHKTSPPGFPALISA